MKHRIARAVLLTVVLAGCSAASSTSATDAGVESSTDAAHGDTGRNHDAGEFDGRLDGPPDASSDRPFLDAPRDVITSAEAALDSALTHDAADEAPAAGTCGGAICFSGQSCVSGACAFPACSGAKVPGDYATVQDAVNGLLPTGGTICLGAMNYAESVTISLTGNRSANPPLVFQGVDPSRTLLGAVTSEAGGFDGQTPSVTFRGIAMASMTLTVGAATVSVSACKLGPFFAYSEAGADAGTILFDEVDLSGGASGTAFTLQDVLPATPGNAIPLVLITNSYIHDSKTGIQIFWGDRGTLTEAGDGLTATLTNNTFENNPTAVSVSVGADSDATPVINQSFMNNLFVGNGLALDLTQTASGGNNAYYGNTTNFMGVAAPASGDVEANPLLDTSTTPPGLLNGSPCRGAANAATATSHDFWGRPRGIAPDIGAVQSSP